jgi:hypothetical protein
MIIYDRRERAQLIWVSHSYPFLIASFHSYLSLDILHHERGSIFTGGVSVLLFFVDIKRGRSKDIQKFILFPYNELKIKIHSFQ